MCDNSYAYSFFTVIHFFTVTHALKQMKVQSIAVFTMVVYHAAKGVKFWPKLSGKIRRNIALLSPMANNPIVHEHAPMRERVTLMQFH